MPTKRMRQTDKQVAAVWFDVAKLRAWKDNPRNNDQAVGPVTESIKRFGFSAPLLVRRQDNQIIAGHTRLRAALALGLKEVPVRFLDLSLSDARLLALADNKLGEISEWDDDRLAAILEDLKVADVDATASGFGAGEIDRLLSDLQTRRLADIDEDPVPAPPAKADSRPGTIYQLGPHRLICGDSTKEETIERLMDGKKADLLFTDPPYGVDYQSNMAKPGKAPRFSKIENDALAPDAFSALLTSAFQQAASALRPGASVYVFHADQRPGLAAIVENALLKNEFHLAGRIVWVKPSASMGHQDYRSRYESIFYGWKLGADHRKVADRGETNVWEIARDAGASYEHPTQKPTALGIRAMKNSSLQGEGVLDLFGGSGSTLISAERCGRRAYLAELDPRYCDVIRQRWSRFAAKVTR